jgi:hypothetical protein
MEWVVDDPCLDFILSSTRRTFYIRYSLVTRILYNLESLDMRNYLNCTTTHSRKSGR